MTTTIKTIVGLSLMIVFTTVMYKSNAQSWNLIGNVATSTDFIGTTNALNFKIRTNNILRMNITSGGKIGIGNFTPVYKLDVKGGSINTDSLYRISGVQVINRDASNRVQIGDNTVKVGIGTATPAAMLDILNTATADLNIKSANGNAKVIIDRGTFSDSALVNFRTGGNDIWQVGTVNDPNITEQDFVINNVSGGAGTYPPSLRIIRSTNDVGIGNRLTVGNGAEVIGVITSNGLQVNGSGTITGGLTINGLTISGVTPVSGQVLTSNGGSNVTWANSTGSVTGTGSASRLAFWSSTTGLSSNSTLFCDGTKLGIGTSSPTVPLEVIGQVKITGGNPMAGRVLTCDATGLASWGTAGSGTVSGSGAATRIAFWSGANALTSSNILVYDAVNNKLGISTSVPDVRLHIGGSDDANLNDGSGEMVIGDINGTNIVFDNNEIIARNDGTTSTLTLNNNGGNLVINGTNATGNVGIATGAPTARLSVNGTADKPGGGVWGSFSDSRLKKDIKPYEDGLNSVLKIKPVRYHYNELAGCDTKIEYVGVVAQDLKNIAPYMVGTFQKEGTEYFNVDNSAMTYMLVNAVKEQQIQIAEKDARIQLLEARMQQFENALSQCCLSFEKKTTDNNEAITDIASLEQNTPNPFSENTVVRFYIPQNVVSALLRIYSLDGSELKSISVSAKGFGQIEISGKTLSAGTYTYMLIIDGKVADTKQMVLTK